MPQATVLTLSQQKGGSMPQYVRGRFSGVRLLLKAKRTGGANKRLAVGVTGVAIGALMLVGIGSPLAVNAQANVPKGSARSSANSTLTISGNTPGSVPDTFNPFVDTSGGVSLDADMMIYEPLLQYNVLRGTQYYPWLATSYRVSNAGRVITFYLRRGVKFSNGLPFTSADVVYSFNVLKQYPALNSTGVVFTSVRANGMYQVIVTLPRADSTAVYDLASTLIVPEQLWRGKNPEKFGDSDPVGTGPYVVKRFSNQALTLVRNPHYWQRGLPKIDELVYPEFDSATTSDLALEDGQLPWAGNYITAVQKLYVDKDPKYRHYWFASVGMVNLVPNVTVYPLNKVDVRKAISDAINRSVVAKIGESGAEAPATSPTDLVLPAQKSFMAPQYARLRYRVNDAAARRLLKSAGLKMGSGGYFESSNGKPITLTLEDPSTYSDYMSDSSIIVQELAAIGLKVVERGVSVDSWVSALASGTFDLTVDYSNFGPGPYYQMQSVLSDTLTAPIGKSASGDWGRWRSAATQRYLNEYLTGVTATQQLNAIRGLESIFVNDVPAIPLVYSAEWYEWDSRNWVGWPTPSNPYVPGEPTGNTAEVVVLHLRPRS